MLVDRGVQIHRENRRCGTVDRHRHRRRGIDEVEPVEQQLHVVERGHGHTRVADLAVDVGTLVGIETVQRHRIERGRQPRCRLVLSQEMESAVRPRRTAFAREHAGGILVFAFEREHPRGEREMTRDVLATQEPDELTVVLEPRKCHSRYQGPRQRFAVLAGHGLDDRGPFVEQRVAGGQVVLDVDPDDLLRGQEVLPGARWSATLCAGFRAIPRVQLPRSPRGTARAPGAR